MPSQGEMLVTEHLGFFSLGERSITKTYDRKMKPNRFR